MGGSSSTSLHAVLLLQSYKSPRSAGRGEACRGGDRTLYIQVREEQENFITFIFQFTSLLLMSYVNKIPTICQFSFWCLLDINLHSCQVSKADN